MSELSKSFEKLIKKYGSIISLKELNDLADQLNENGYFIEIEHSDKLGINTKEKSGIFELYRRLKSRKIMLSEAQQYMYKI